LGYSATNHNFIYLCLTSSIAKQSHHAQFNEALYLQPSWPPAAQLLYDLGVGLDTVVYSKEGSVTKDSVESEYWIPGTVETIQVPWPLSAALPPVKDIWKVPLSLALHPLPLHHMPAVDPTPRTIAAKAARTIVDKSSRRISSQPQASNILLDFDVGHGNMSMIYMPHDLYFGACEQLLDLRKFDLGKHATASLNLYRSGGRVHIATMSHSTPAAKIPKWRTRMRGTWLIKIDDIVISTVVEAGQALKSLVEFGGSTATLLFAYPEICPNLSKNLSQSVSQWSTHCFISVFPSTCPQPIK
jgi:hypothetical protein